MNKKWIVGIVIVILIGVALFGFGSQQAVAVETVEIKGTVFTDSFREDGIVYAKAERPVYSETSGIVEDIHLENGDEVLVGDIILALDTKQLELRKKAVQGQIMSIEGQLAAEGEKVKSPDLSAQKNMVNIAKANMEQSQIDLERSKTLLDSGAISVSAYEEAEKIFDSSVETYNMEASRLSGLTAQNTVGEGTSTFYSGQLMQLQAELEIIEDQIDKSVVRAKMKGTVSALTIKEGEAVQQMTAVANIIDDNQIKIESLVLAEDTPGLELSQSVQIVRTRKGIEEEIEGKIVKIDPVASETVSALGLKERRVLITVVPNTDTDYTLNLIHGSDVDVEFIAYKSEHALVVPKSSVFPTESGDAVWLVKDGVISLNHIETGYEATRYIEVLSGLGEGDHVLKNYDTEGIADGAKAKPSNL